MTMTPLRLGALLAPLVLMACTATPTIRVDSPSVSTGGQVRIAARSVEVRDVSLPLYAGQEAIFIETPAGALISDDSLLWADDPVRSITQDLALTLATITPARVAAEPWPFFENPDARVEVRFSRALAGRDGQFRLAGQYFVASGNGDRADIARRFDIAAPYDTANLGSIATARAVAVANLARQIARDGL